MLSKQNLNRLLFLGRDLGTDGNSGGFISVLLGFFFSLGFKLNKRWTGVENTMGLMIQPMTEQWYDSEASHLGAVKKKLFSFSKVPPV